MLGATGSVGTAALDLIAGAAEPFEVVALSAQRNVAELARLARRHRARFAAIADASLLGELRERLAGSGIAAGGGPEALIEAAERASDCVIAAIVGAAGLAPTLAAVGQTRRIALANKECLVSAGDVFMQALAAAGTELIPVDSEHSAAFQALAGADPDAVERITLTASGGPFLGWDMTRLARATPEEAVRHPRWSMGPKISIDSATLMNKGLELIEAYHLFPLRADQLDVVVHPQSIVHCLVAYTDGSVLAQLACPDMRTPIAVSLAHPARMAAPTERLDLVKLGTLSFEAPDERRFPALTLARQALARGGTAPAILNAANEIAVAAFLDRRIGFLDISAIVSKTLEAADKSGHMRGLGTLEDVLEADAAGRELASATTAMACARR